MNLPAARALALAALLGAASLHAQEPGRAALCRAFEGKGSDLTLVNLVPRRPAGGVVELQDLDVDADGRPDAIRLDCMPAQPGGSERCVLGVTLADGQRLALEREHIALVQAGDRIYVSSARTVCRAHKSVQSAELAAVVKGRFATRCGPVVTSLTASGSPDC